MLVLGIDHGHGPDGLRGDRGGTPTKGRGLRSNRVEQFHALGATACTSYTPTLLNLIHIFSPDAVAVEEPFVGRGERRFVGPAIAVGQAQGLVLIGAAGQGLPVYRYSPAQIKHAIVDYGARHQSPGTADYSGHLGSEARCPESDAADALAVGLCHLNHSQADSALAREILPGQERQ